MLVKGGERKAIKLEGETSINLKRKEEATVQNVVSDRLFFCYLYSPLTNVRDLAADGHTHKHKWHTKKVMNLKNKM